VCAHVPVWTVGIIFAFFIFFVLISIFLIEELAVHVQQYMYSTCIDQLYVVIHHNT
jgi:hypothetical protein